MPGIKREHLWALLALGIAIGLAYILLSIAREDASSQSIPQVPRCIKTEDRDEILALAFRGYEEAFVKHMSRLFDVWVTDPDQISPSRAQKGTQNGIRAYLHARELTMKWAPPVC